MTGYAFHPLANLFPLIGGKEFDELVDDVRTNGLRHRIVIHEGMILDGRNRYRAALAAGLFSKDDDLSGGSALFIRHFSKFLPDRYGDPLKYVLSLNLARRHLNESQRAMVAARLATMRQGERTDLVEPSANLPKVDQADAAKRLSISERSLRTAKGVQERAAPEVSDAVDRGEVSVSAAAAIATLPVDEQKKIIAEVAKAPDTRRAFTGVVKDLRRERQDEKKIARQAKEKKLGERQQALPVEKFGVIYADPEWEDEVWSKDTGMDRHPSNHYRTSKTLDIITRDVASIAADHSACFMWAKANMLPAALKVLEGWGFVYKTHWIWAKDRPGNARGMGRWLSDEHELLLLGTKGSPPAPTGDLQRRSLIHAPVGRHSEKPEVFAEMIEDYFPTFTKIELNARRTRPGWTPWGDEAPDGQAEATTESAPNIPENIPEPRETAVATPPPIDDGLDIPNFLSRKLHPELSSHAR